MTKYNLMITYEPKIQGVLEGTCTQTIRVGEKFKVGDYISFHGWVGRPYRSKWSWRTPYWEVIEVINIQLHNAGIYFCDEGRAYLWSDKEIDDLAILDGVESGLLLRDYFNPLFDGYEWQKIAAQVIRWRYCKE